MTLSASKCSPLSCQRWSPRGHILKYLALASKPISPRKCPVLGSRTALFLWPRKCLYSKSRSLASNYFFKSLALVSNVGSLTPPLLNAFFIHSRSSLHRRNTFRKKLMLRECKDILKQVASNGEVENLWTTISCDFMWPA